MRGLNQVEKEQNNNVIWRSQEKRGATKEVATKNNNKARQPAQPKKM
jgi:hypothetical protein